MISPLTDQIYDLDMAKAFSIDRAYHRTIRSFETHLWITEEGWSNDMIVAPGDEYTIQGKGRVVVTALGNRLRFAISPCASRIAHLILRVRCALQRRGTRSGHCCAGQISPNQ